MIIRKKNNIVFFSALLSIYVFAWLIHQSLYINWDVSQLLASTKLLLQGGTYTRDFFIPNPPMILYLYVPPILIFKYLHINLEVVFNAYIFFISTISLVLSYQLSKTIFLPKDYYLRDGFILLVAITYLIVPMFEFAQRDYLLMVFSFPYILMTFNRLEKNQFSTASAITIGIFAGIGFAIKPQFLIVLAFVEFYFCYATRSVFAWMRTEVFTIIIFLSAYVSTIYLFFSDYFFVIIPYLLKHYINSVAAPWLKLISNELIWIYCGAVCIWLTQRKHLCYQRFITFLVVVATAFLVLYIIQRSVFLHHIIPIFSLTIVLLYLIYADVIRQLFESNNNIKITMLMTVLIGVLIFYYPLYILNGFYKHGIRYKHLILTPLVKFMRQEPPNQSLYALTNLPNLLAPLTDYTGSPIAERFDCLWMVTDYKKRFTASPDSKLRNHIRNNTDKTFFVNMVAEDFKQKKPDIVFIYDVIGSNFLTGELVYFDFLSYFLENPRFKKEWQHYKYVGNLNSNKNAYSKNALKIYKRISLHTKKVEKNSK